jgi:uncharacterized lipoprotein YajG
MQRATTMRFLASLLLPAAAVIASCGTTTSTVLTNTPPRPTTPPSPASVDVLTVAPDNRPFVEIAVIDVELA